MIPAYFRASSKDGRRKAALPVFENGLDAETGEVTSPMAKPARMRKAAQKNGERRDRERRHRSGTAVRFRFLASCPIICKSSLLGKAKHRDTKAAMDRFEVRTGWWLYRDRPDY